MKQMNQECNAMKTLLGRSNNKHTIKHPSNTTKREGKHTKQREEGRRKRGRASKA